MVDKSGLFSALADNHVIRAPIAYGRSNDDGDLLVELYFGIQPISIAGGAVKVKDELRIAFDIVTVSR